MKTKKILQLISVLSVLLFLFASCYPGSDSGLSPSINNIIQSITGNNSNNNTNNGTDNNTSVNDNEASSTNCNHSITVVIKGNDATCTENGLTDGTKCLRCGKVITEQAVIDMQDHVISVLPRVEPTCTEAGLTEGKHCTVCKTVFVNQESIPALGHNVIIEKGYAATCTVDGLTDSEKCQSCDAILSAATVIPSQGHKYSDGLCIICDSDLSDYFYESIITVSPSFASRLTGLSVRSTYPINELILPAKENNTWIGEYLTKNANITELITKLYIPDTIVAITTLSDLGNLESIRLSSNIRYISDGVFNSLKNLSFNEYDNAYYLGNEVNPYIVLVKAKDTSITSCTIAESTQIIMSNAFYDCYKLQYNIHNGINYLGSENNPYFAAISGLNNCDSYIIHNDTVIIADSAFEFDSISSITISENVKYIGKTAFYHCKNLVEINYNATNASDLTIFSNVFAGVGSDSEGVTVNIGSNVARIPSCLFYASKHQYDKYSINDYKSNITGIIFANRSRSIEIGVDAFSDLTKLTYVDLPQNCDVIIGAGAFCNCSSLANITLGSNIKSIDTAAFAGCTSLVKITIPESITIIDSSTFKNCTNLTDVIIPNSVIDIGNSAFEGCLNLANITIPDNVVYIGSNAFADCSSLTSIVIPDKVTSIEARAFKNCSQITSVVIGNSVTSIGYLAFGDCKNLKSFTAGNSLTSVDENAFTNCKISYVSAPSVLIKQLDSYYLETVIITGDTYIGDYAFQNYINLKNVTLPDGITYIGKYAFSGCQQLTNITIPESVTTIKESAFSWCRNLTTIVITDKLERIDAYAFQGCSNLTSVYYFGNPDEFANVKIGINNDSITSATIYFYSETLPEIEGNFWYYNEKHEVTVW